MDRVELDGPGRDIEEVRSVPRRMPRRRRSVTRSFTVGEAQGYLTTSLYDDGTVGEIDLRMDKQGSMLSGMADCLAGAVSLGLQQGAPLDVYVHRFVDERSEPEAVTDDSELPWVCSAVDYLGRRLAVDHLPVDVRQGLGIRTDREQAADDGPHAMAT